MNVNEHDNDFKAMANDAGLPTTEQAIKAQYDNYRQASGIEITNTSAFGPFWRFLDAIAIKTAKTLMDFVVYSVLPQSFLKTARGLMLRVHAWQFNVIPKTKTKAVGRVTFIRNDAADTVLTIAAGTEVYSPTINGKIYTFVTQHHAVLNSGVNHVDVLVDAEHAGSDYNLGAGFLVHHRPVIAGLNVTNGPDWIVAAGTDDERDEDIRERVQNKFSAANRWHIDAAYIDILSQFDGVSPRNIFFQKDAPRGPGTANAYILKDVGNTDRLLIQRMQSEITEQQNHGHGDDLQVFQIPDTQHDITCGVWFIPGTEPQTATQVLDQVSNFIRCAFRENSLYNVTTTLPRSLFSFSKLSEELHKQFPMIRNVAFNLNNIESQLNIPRIKSLQVTHNV